MVAWMSYQMGDLETGERDSAEMVARVLPGQAPYTALHLFAWRAVILYMLGRWDAAAQMFWRGLEAWHDAGSHAAGYGLRGFTVGLDIGRGRGDGRLIGAATTAIESVIARYSEGQLYRFYARYVQGDVAYEPDAVFPSHGYLIADLVERRLNFANDARLPVPPQIIEGGLARAERDVLPMLEAQLRRARALTAGDAEEMSRAIAIWERVGALTMLGRARAERGLLLHDAAETEAGLAILKKIGDGNYVDRFVAHVV